MSFNVSEFTSKINERNGYARTNKFEINIPVPTIIPKIGGEIARDLKFYCSDAVLPGYQIMTGNVRRHTYGTNEVRPFSPNFQQVQLVFNVDGDFDTWNYFNDWMQTIIPHDGANMDNNSEFSVGKPYEIAYKKDYAVDMNIKVMSEDGFQIKEVFLREAFPSNVNLIQLSWADQNQISQFTVFIEYLDWSEQINKSESQPNQPQQQALTGAGLL